MRSHRTASIVAWVSTYALAGLPSCKACKDEAPPATRDASESVVAPPDASDTADGEEGGTLNEMVDASTPFELTLTGKCAGHLPTARDPSDDEVTALVLPGFDAASHTLRARDAGSPQEYGYPVELCAGDAVSLTEPPSLGAPTRARIPGDGDGGTSREIVQIPLGMRAGLVRAGAGMLAVVARTGAELRVVGTSESGGTIEDKPDLDPVRVVRMGPTYVAVVDTPDPPWGEQPVGQQTSAVRLLDDPRLEMVALIPTSMRSNGVFWRAPYAMAMKSGGLRPSASGLAVDEQWTFTKGKESKTRSVVRRYTLRDRTVTQDPQLDLQRWPETRDPRLP